MQTFTHEHPTHNTDKAFNKTTLINKVKYRVKTEDPNNEKTKLVKAESENGEKAIILKGPLSEIFYRALNILYAKKSHAEEETKASIESLMTGMPLFVNYENDDDNEFPQQVKILGYNASDLKAVNVPEMIEEFKTTDKNNLLKIVINKNEKNLNKEAVRAVSTMESLGVEVYTSLEDALNSIALKRV